MTPSVMLSPNAIKVETRSRGIRVTRIEKPHDAARPMASVAVHETVVAPTGNNAPLPGAHATARGVEPPVATGAVYDTATGFPSADCAAPSVGHVIAGAAGVGVGVGVGVGAVGDEQDTPSASSAAVANRLHRRQAGVKRKGMIE
jgi:hypothetical protein